MNPHVDVRITEFYDGYVDELRGVTRGVLALPKYAGHGWRFKPTHQTQAMKTGWKSRRSQSKAGGAFWSPGMLP